MTTTYKKILLPLDGSKLAEAPLEYAVWLAQKTGAELHLLQVDNEKTGAAKNYIDEIVKNTSLKNVKAADLSGDPASEILHYADEQDIDIITMSTHGRTGIKRWILGSVADKVVRYSSRPVRLLKSFPDRSGEEHDNTILALLDGSETSEQVLPYAVYHTRISGGTLVLMNVCEPPVVVPSYSYNFSPHIEYPPEKPQQWEDYVKEENKKRKNECKLYMEKIGGQMDKDLKTKVVNPFGDPVEEILKYLDKNTVRLVAMTTKGRSGFSRWAMGSVAEKVLQASTSPLLLIHPKEEAGR